MWNDLRKSGCVTDHKAVANLYYNHPILNILAHDFNVTNEQASLVPTLAQAGYAGGLLFRKHNSNAALFWY